MRAATTKSSDHRKRSNKMVYSDGYVMQLNPKQYENNVVVSRLYKYSQITQVYAYCA